MAFSISNWFKGKPEDGSPETQVENGEAPPPAAGISDQQAAPAPKVRVTGRVTARAVRAVTPQAAAPASLRAPSARQAITLPIGPGREVPEAPGRGMLAPPPTTRRISLGTSADPLAVPLAEPPRPEPASPAPVPVGPDVKVTLEVGDFIDRLPSALVQAGALDRQKKVEFRSSELYSDLTRGRASVPASTIYERCAEIFSRPISATEDVEIALPLQKLVEQMSGAFETRRDQVAVENVGEIETPFLQVALEDNARLPKAAGTSAGPIAPPRAIAAEPQSLEQPLREHHRTGPISTITPPKGSADAGSPPMTPPASVTTNLKRPPSTVRASVAGAKIRVSGPASPSRIKPALNIPAVEAKVADTTDAASPTPAPQPPPPASPSLQVTKKTARIQIPPISLRVAGAPPKQGPATPPVIPTQPGTATLRPAPASPEAAPTFRSAPGSGGAGAATFRSTPPPAIKPPPPSFAPRRTNRTPPSSPPPVAPVVREAPVVTPSIAAVTSPEAVPAPLPAPSSLPADDDREIVLNLRAVLRGLPSVFLTGDVAGVPQDVAVKLPFRLIASQLSSGRVAIAFGVFLEAVPTEYRSLLADDAELPEVPLPLPEIFQNLPSSALSIRTDQVVEETGSSYLTPFSQKAEEDAKRFGVEEAVLPAPPVKAPVKDAAPAAAVSAPTSEVKSKTAPAPVVERPKAVRAVEEPAPAPIFAEKILPELQPAKPSLAETPLEERTPEKPPAEVVSAVGAPAPDEPKVAAPPEPAAPRSVIPTSPAGSPAQAVLQQLFMTDDELDAKTVVKLVSQFPGIDGCTVMFGDGLRLAGNFPENGQAEGFSAMSPPFYKRTMHFAAELKLGALKAFTIYTETGLLSFFMHDDICLSVRHTGRGFLPGVREKLETVTRELAQLYSASPASAAN